MPGYPHIPRKNYCKWAKRKPETSSVTADQKRQKCTAIPEAHSLSQLEDSNKSGSHCGVPELSKPPNPSSILRPEWFKGKKFKTYALELVGIPYLDNGKVSFTMWFELKKYGKHRAKRYQKTVLPKYTTVVDASSWIGVFYNWINNHITKGTVKELCWSRWLDKVQNICKS